MAQREEALEDPPGDERVDDTGQHVDRVVLARVDDCERHTEGLQRLRAEKPVREAVLADDEEADDRPRRVQLRDC